MREYTLNGRFKDGLATVYRASISDLGHEFKSVSWNNRDIPLLEYAKMLFQNKRTLVDSGGGRLTVEKFLKMIFSRPSPCRKRSSREFEFCPAYVVIRSGATACRRIAGQFDHPTHFLERMSSSRVQAARGSWGCTYGGSAPSSTTQADSGTAIGQTVQFCPIGRGVRCQPPDDLPGYQHPAGSGHSCSLRRRAARLLHASSVVVTCQSAQFK